LHECTYDQTKEHHINCKVQDKFEHLADEPPILCQKGGDPDRPTDCKYRSESARGIL